jgi:hypothetical protein
MVASIWSRNPSSWARMDASLPLIDLRRGLRPRSRLIRLELIRLEPILVKTNSLKTHNLFTIEFVIGWTALCCLKTAC